MMDSDSDEGSLLGDTDSVHVSSFDDERSDSSDSEGFSDDDSEEDEPTLADVRAWQIEPQPTIPHPRFPFVFGNQNIPADGNALDFLNLYFDDELINIIVTETNRYALQKGDRDFPNTNAREIRVFLALVMLQGLVVKSSHWLYWSKKPLLDTPFFRECMPLKRFKALKKYLHFANSEDYNPETHPQPKLNKIYPIYQLLSNKFKTLYKLDRDVTIDESLMLYKGRLGWVQYIPLKRARFGIKFYMLCESSTGYVWSTIIYTGKGTQMDEKYKDLPAVSSKIVMSMMDPLLNKGHCLTTDNFYTSPALAELLINNRTDTYGTVKQNRKDMPPQIKSKKLKKGETIAFRRGKVLTMKWKDKRDVTLLSTVHPSEMVQCQRGRVATSIPRIVKDYNDTMGGVDRVDQSLSSYPIMRKRGKKYYQKIFFHLLELAVWNSYILYKQAGHTKKPLDFRMDLIDLLVSTYKDNSVKSKGRPSTTPSPLRLSGRHFLDYVPPTEKKDKPMRYCAVCSQKRNALGKKVRRESRYQCSECDVGLCVVPCFREYHTKVDLT